MGCWNESCMVTGLPILSGDECAVVLLMESPFSNSGCYASNAYTPFFLIQGRYDDYGGLEDNPQNHKYLELLRNAMPGEKTEQSLIDWFNGIILDGVRINAVGMLPKDLSSKTELMVRAVFLHKSVLKMADENMKHTEANTDSILFRIKEVVSAGSAREDASNEKDNFLALIDADYQLDHTISEMMRILSESAPNTLARNIIKAMICSNSTFACHNMEHLVNMTILLSDLRKAWHIPSGKGSQDCENMAQKLFLACYRERLDEIAHRYDD